MRVREAGTRSFLEEVAAMPGGEAIRLCIQCGTCTGACPNADRMDHPPRKIIAMVRAGLREEVLSSNSMWFCASCYLCTVRCPRDIKPTALMHVLENLSAHHGLITKSTGTPAMYQSFVDSIRRNGRVHEFSMMLRFYLRTNPFASLGMIPVALALFSRGRIPLMPTRIKGRGQLKAILEKARALGGA
ncbi:MAG: heterodisulfide reductase [Dehalococcoidia bacterium]|nr:MAG: heterodisulfide reductase [Dehalococcoidia bacterium]